MAKKQQEKEKTIPELLQEMRTKGVEHQIPGTNRIIRLRTLDASALLREGKVPDILTPLVVKSLYQEVADRELRDFLGQNRSNVTEALKFVDTLDFVCEKVITDGTKVNELTIGEKRWIFRLVMGPAELLVTFRYDPNADVESVAEVEDLPQDAE